jgi:hypothetical protein
MDGMLLGDAKPQRTILHMEIGDPKARGAMDDPIPFAVEEAAFF